MYLPETIAALTKTPLVIIKVKQVKCHTNGCMLPYHVSHSFFSLFALYCMKTICQFNYIWIHIILHRRYSNQLCHTLSNAPLTFCVCHVLHIRRFKRYSKRKKSKASARQKMCLCVGYLKGKCHFPSVSWNIVYHSPILLVFLFKTGRPAQLFWCLRPLAIIVVTPQTTIYISLNEREILDSEAITSDQEVRTTILTF